MKLHLAEHLSLPLDVVTEKLCWLGRTGSGKTYGAMKLAELMLDAGAQIGALDPVGVWRGLRVPAKKGGPSFEVVVFGGLYYDLPLEPHVGELIADLVCDRGLSFVLDVSQFIPSEQQRFVRAFADRFFHRKKSAPSAVHLFMEECQEFLPENPSGEEAKTLGVMQRLWKLGRNFGIGGSLISQRPQEVAKKALNMSGTMFAFQMTGPQERKAVKSWVADHGVAIDIESVLQKLRVGEPHVESPMFLEISKAVRILPRVTADLSSTPKVGASTAAKRPLTPIDVEQLKASMSATIEKAEASDPKKLQAKLQQAKAELAKKEALLAEIDQRTQRIDAKLQRVKPAPALTDADRALLEKLADRLAGQSVLLREKWAEAIEEAKRAVIEAGTRCWAEVIASRSGLTEELEKTLESKGFQKVLAKLAGIQTIPAGIKIIPAKQDNPRENLSRRVASPVATRRPAAQVHADGALGLGERRVLTALAQYPNGLTREHISILAGYKRSTRDRYLQFLQSKGFAVERDDGLVATAEGLEALGDFNPLPTGSALREHWLQKLPAGEKAIFQVLVEAEGQPVDREVISEATGYKRSTRDRYLQFLQTRKLVIADREGVRASDELFSVH